MKHLTESYNPKGPTEQELESIREQVRKRFEDDRCIRTLSLFVLLGIADRNQIQQFTGLSRRQLDLVLKTFEEIAGDQILRISPFGIRRPGSGRGRSITLFMLSPVGAALLRANGFPNAKPCNLSDERAVNHAYALLSLYLCAKASNLEAQIEAVIPYDLESADDHSIRADLLIMNEDNKRHIYEIEQDADITTLRRIIKYLHNRHAFFQSAESEGISRIVFTLFNLQRDSVFNRMMQVWERAIQIVIEELGGNLSFRPLLTTLSAFLDAPDWSGEGQSDLWELLVDPAYLPDFGPSDVKIVKYEDPSPPGKQKELPNSVIQYTPSEDILILKALYQAMLEKNQKPSAHKGNLDLFEIVKIIYIASHPLDASPQQLAMVARASLYLLQRYLQLHPKLRTSLSKAMIAGGSMRWTITLIQFRMQVVIARFLHYHGFRNSSPLTVKPVIHWNDIDRSGSMAISVHIDPALLMREGDTIVPSYEEVALTERALGWVLLALFEHSNEIGIKRPKFW